MRFVRVSVVQAVLLGLVSQTSAFLPPLGGNNAQFVLVPAARYNAAVAGGRRHRSAAQTARMSTEVEPLASIANAIGDVKEAVQGGLEAAGAAIESVTGGGDDAEAPVKKALSELVVGAEYEGIVNNVVNYGCFVDIGAETNGLVHISQMADDFVTSTESIVKEGDTVKVKLVSVDLDAQKVVLTMRNSPRKAHTQQTADVSKYAAMLASDPNAFLPGTVESIVSYGAFINLEEGTSGFLHISQLKPKTEHVTDPNEVLTVGQEVQVRLREVDEETKRINLSLQPVASNSNAKDVSPLVDADKSELRTGKITSIHDYGFFAAIDAGEQTVDGLVHISKVQSGAKLSAEELKERFTVGQEVQCRILSVSADTNKLSLTMLEPEKQADLSKFADLPEGTWLDGTVMSITPYGAFINLKHDGEDVDGMAHISELSEERLEAVTDAVNVGDQVKVRVIQVQPELRKIRLSMRQPGADGGDAQRSGGRRDRKPRGPKDVSKYAAMDSDAVLEGKVVSVMSYGAFVQLEAGVDALLHVSHMSDERVEQPSDVVTVGQTVSVRLLEVDEATGRIGVTMRSPGGSRGGSSGGQQQRGGGGQRSRDVSPLVNFDSTVLLDGTVKTLLPYGSFVSFTADGATYEGLVHISAISEERVEDVNDVLSEGQAVKVRVIDVDTEASKISLSMLAAGSAKDERRSGGGSRDDESDSAEDSFGGGARKKSPRPRFNDAFEDATATEGRAGGASGESDWQKYLDQYYEKRN